MKPYKLFACGLCLFLLASCGTTAPKNAEGTTTLSYEQITSGGTAASTSEGTEETTVSTKTKTQAQTDTTKKTSEKNAETTTKKDDNLIGNIVPVYAKIDKDKWYLTLVNRRYKLPESFKVDICPVGGSSEVELDVRVAPYYDKMYAAAKKDGCLLTPYSGHRRRSTQERNYKNKIQEFLNDGYSQAQAEDKASRIILPPGTSEHELGLAMDIVNTKDSFENTKEFKWLNAHAHEYGFILRYPKDKQKITDIVYEPWHWRYVGVEDAKKIKASGKCLEEYLGIY